MKGIPSRFILGAFLALCVIVFSGTWVIGQDKPKREKFNTKEKPLLFDKNSTSEFSFGLLVGIYQLDGFNDRLRAANLPTFSPLDGSVHFQYMKTLKGNWALSAEFGLSLSQTERNDEVENRLNYNSLRVFVGKDLLKDERRRLIPMLGGSFGESTFSSVLRNTEAVGFDDIISMQGPRNAALVNSILFGLDFRITYEWLDFLRSGEKYDKWSLIAGYHLPLTNNYRNPVNNMPEFRPAGPYIGYVNSFGFEKVKK
jgi:hypothetical protein